MSRNAAAFAIGPLAIALALGLSVVPARADPQSSAPVARAPATAQERAAYDRLDPLARSVFWSREQEIDPADPAAGPKLAEALRQLGQYDQAASIAQQALVTQPANVDAMLELGRAHIARGQAFYGIAALEQARATAPRDWRPLSLLGVAYNQVRRADDARAAWNEGLRLSPDNPDILTNAAIALTADGNAPAAEALLRRAVLQPGATLKTRQNLALVLGLQGKTAEAEQIIRRDLPPEAADRNLQWLNQKAGPAPVASDPSLSGTARTWNSIQGQ